MKKSIKSIALILLFILLAYLACLTISNTETFEDGSGRIFGKPFCIPFQICNEG